MPAEQKKSTRIPLQTLGRRLERTLGRSVSPPMRVLRSLGVRARRLIARGGITRRAYRKWIERYDDISPQLRTLMADEMSAWPSHPLISVVMPSYNIHPRWMTEAIESVLNQIYPHWELCISDDASTMAGIQPLLERYAAQNSRIHVTFRSNNGHISVNSNNALDLARGDYIALLDADDRLSGDALFWVAREIALHPELDLLFSDEDKIDRGGRRFDPYFKSAWNPALMLSQNAFSHLGVYRRSLVEQVGRFREGYEGSQDYDLVLRCAAKTTTDRIRHVPRVLYHWRALPGSAAREMSAKSYAWQAGRSAIADHLQRVGVKAQVRPAFGHYFQTEYEAPGQQPLVSLVVPSILSSSTAASCLRSVLTKSTYLNFELLMMARPEHLHRAKDDPEFAGILADRRVRAVEHTEAPFNHSRVSNLGARLARGSILCFLNDDVEVITEDWLEHLVARVMLDGVGAAAPMLYYPSGSIQHAGVVLGVGGMADHAFRRHRKGRGGYFGRAGLEQDYSCLTAACLVVRRETFDAAGQFEEALPVAFNDVDLCIRMRRTRARIVWTPTVQMYHHESITLGHHASAQRRDQFRHDVQLLRQRWHDVLRSDPCYNPNLSLIPGAMFTLAWPPRVTERAELVASAKMTAISRTSNLVCQNQ